MYKHINELTSGYKQKRFLKNYDGSLIITNDVKLVKKREIILIICLTAKNPKRCLEPSLKEIEFHINNLKNHKPLEEDPC